jgi:hypothetical protein
VTGMGSAMMFVGWMDGTGEGDASYITSYSRTYRIKADVIECSLTWNHDEKPTVF